ncbi:MAG: kelch repeat-containing protein [Myxococcales bacterium]
MRAFRLARPLAAAALAALAGPACFPTEPPDDLQIACKQDEDCPAKYVCSKLAGRCFPSDVVDKAPELVGTPVIEPKVARAGVTLTVSLAVNEPLLNDPVVTVGTRRIAVDETGTARTKLSYRFAYKVVGRNTEPEDQPLPVTIELVDTKGNASAKLDGGKAFFDFSAPPAPDVLAPDKVVYHRVPWGAEATGGQKRFWIDTKAGATEAGAQVVAYDSAGAVDDPAASELGRTVAAADGSFQLELMRADRPVIWLVAFDAAGNPSPVVDVKDVSWTATLKDKVPGKEFENPHDYELRPWFERRYRQPDARELTDSEPISARGGRTLVATGETAAGAWLRKSVGELYTRRHSHAAAFDSARRKTVVFGGEGWGDTWTWDGAAWSKSSPLDLAKDGNPSTRARHAMAYDAERDRVVLFGGTDHNGQPLDDTWEWDGVEWVARAPHESPPARFSHALVYDPARRKVVLFGGQTLDAQGRTTYLSDLWEWNGTTWAKGANATPPSGRAGHAMAMDTARGRLVLFGGKGLDASGTAMVTKDTWEYDGAAWKRIPADAPPKARQFAAAAFMPERGVVLFGGEDGQSEDAQRFDDTWVWSGQAWTQLQLPVSPDKRSLHVLVFDSGRNRAVLVGGKDDNDLFEDTWELEGDRWLARTGPSSEERAPEARAGHAMAQDEARGVTVLFGGANADADGNRLYLDDVWEWDGTSWTDRTPAASEPRPLARMSAAMAYDRVRQRVVLHGGVDDVGPFDDTWEWDGARWKERTPTDPNASPGLRYGHVMVFDDHEGEMVLYGGTDERYKGWASFADTWLWDGSLWRPARYAGTPPSGRSYTAMAYDQVRKRVVLYGGQAFWSAEEMCPPCGFPYAARDTFEWDGSRWKEVFPEGEAAPATLVSHAMAYSQRGAVLMFGGGTWISGGSPLDETWSWDGTSWTQAAHGAHDDGSPEARSGHTLVYDARRSRAVLFGGANKESRLLGDTWEWDDGSFARPGQVARFAFAAAQAEEATAIESIHATWIAGGVGENDRNAVSGVSTWVWDRGSFLSVSSGSYPVESPGIVTWSVEDPGLAARLLTGPRQEITLAVTPQGANGTKSAQVAVDDVELEVRYRRPIAGQ